MIRDAAMDHAQQAVPPNARTEVAAISARIQRWRDYLDALDRAGQALDLARRLVPDHGLDHGVDRVRALLCAGAAELDAMERALAAQPAAG